MKGFWWTVPGRGNANVPRPLYHQANRKPGPPDSSKKELQTTYANSQRRAFVSRLMQTPFSCQPSAFYQMLLTQCCTLHKGEPLFIQRCTWVTPFCFLSMEAHCWHTCRAEETSRVRLYLSLIPAQTYLESWDEKKPKTPHQFLFPLVISVLDSSPVLDNL